ncbi:MAG: MBL fold metallo-hydrolase [Chloroflexi bacterium]|nr:MBL fold metallo-hydrolase [Chloroflexota bacterium]
MSNHLFVDTRHIGDATVTVISEGILPWALQLQTPEAEWRVAIPDADERGVLRLGLNLVHIQLGDASILVDPGFADPSSDRDEGWPGLERSPGLSAALQSLGIAPEQITHVLITHTHSDHYAGVTVERNGERVLRYPNARYYVGRADWEQSPQRPDSPLATHLGTLARAGVLKLVEEHCAVASGVSMLAAPGESPGHCVVRVESNGETFYYLGDLFHHAAEIAHPQWVSPGRDARAMLASREQVMADAAASRATIVFAHEPFPPWGRIAQTADGNRWVRS